MQVTYSFLVPQNLDLTKKKMVHEGPLSWKINKDKTIGKPLLSNFPKACFFDDCIIILESVFASELYTLLLEDILVLLQKQDERFILRCYSKNLTGTADTKHKFSPIIKLNTVLVRSVATGEHLTSHLSHTLSPHIFKNESLQGSWFPRTDNRSFFVISMSENGAQIYELMAQTVSEQRM